MEKIVKLLPWMLQASVSTVIAIVSVIVLTCSDTLLPVIIFVFAGIFLRFNNTIFPNSSSVLVSDLQPIQCHSDNSEANGQPEWRFPNGTRVREDGEIVATKQQGYVTLRWAHSAMSVPLGEYCCLAQDARGRNHTLCANIIEGKSTQQLHVW